MDGGATRWCVYMYILYVCVYRNSAKPNLPNSFIFSGDNLSRKRDLVSDGRSSNFKLILTKDINFHNFGRQKFRLILTKKKI